MPFFLIVNEGKIMTPSEALGTLLKSYRQYYTITTDCVELPFAAEAVFHSHDEQYFLVRSARLGEAESNEYVFFALGGDVDLDQMRRLETCAWERGISRVRPHSEHRNTDVAFILLAEHIDLNARDYIRQAKRYQSYRFTFYGFSHFKAIALETSSGELFCNKRGRDLRKLFRNIQTTINHEGGR